VKSYARMIAADLVKKGGKVGGEKKTVETPVTRQPPIVVKVEEEVPPIPAAPHVPQTTPIKTPTPPRSPRVKCHRCRVDTHVVDKYEAHRNHVYVYHPPDEGVSLASEQSHLAKTVAECFPTAKVLNDSMCQLPGCYHMLKFNSLPKFDELKWDHVLREHTLRDIFLRCPVEGCGHTVEKPFGQVFDELCDHLREQDSGHGQVRAKRKDVETVMEDYKAKTEEMIADRSIVSLMTQCFPCVPGSGQRVKRYSG